MIGVYFSKTRINVLTITEGEKEVLKRYIKRGLGGHCLFIEGAATIVMMNKPRRAIQDHMEKVCLWRRGIFKSKVML